MDGHLEDALAARGLNVRSGDEAVKPADVDFYATYNDTWRWDITMYLKDLQIRFYQSKSNALISSGSFSNSFMHSFPDAGKKVSEVVATMYGEKIAAEK